MKEKDTVNVKKLAVDVEQNVGTLLKPFIAKVDRQKLSDSYKKSTRVK